MKNISSISFLILILLVFVPEIFSQPTPIGLGWAKNSVNAPVFRKNSVTSFEGIQYTAFYDSTGYVVLAKRSLGTDDWETSKTTYTGNINDAHNSISIALDGDGYLHMAWDQHNNSLRYCKGLEPGSLQLGEEGSMIGSQENNVTYPEFFRMPNGDLIFMYRHGVSGSGNMVINRYRHKEQEWERLHDVLIDGEGQRNAYWQSCVDINGTIHVSWVWRQSWDVATNHDLCYAKSTDGGLTWQKSNGELYELPIKYSSAEFAKKIPQNSELINQTSMYACSNGIPYIASYWTPVGSSIPQYHMVYLDDENEWQSMQISNRISPFSLSGGGTKKIPVSRPQILIDDRDGNTTAYLIFRDEERGSKVSVSVCDDLDSELWTVYDLTNFSVNSWEPSYDTDLWKDSMILNLFVQKMGQGDGENLEDLPAQPVYILEGLDGVPDNSVYLPMNSPMEQPALIYPNPVSDELIIYGVAGNAVMTIINLDGKIIYQGSVNSTPLNFDVGDFSKGLYFIHLYGNETNISSRFIKI